MNLGLTGAHAVWDDLWPPAPACGLAPVYKLLYQSDKQGWPGTCALSMILKLNQGVFFNGGSVKLIYGGTESLQCFSGFLRTSVMLSLGCWSGKCECCVALYWKDFKKKILFVLCSLSMQLMYTFMTKCLCISTVTFTLIQNSVLIQSYSGICFHLKG